MISIEEYKQIISELLDELPAEFFQKLNGGVIVSEALVIPDYAGEMIFIPWDSIRFIPVYDRLSCSRVLLTGATRTRM